MIIQRVMMVEWLLDLYKRGRAERKLYQAAKALDLRQKMLKAMRERRGYEA